MPKTQETVPESPVQITLRSGSGVIFTFDLPLGEHVQRQYDRGELARCNPDGSPYTGPGWTLAADSALAPADAHGLDEYERTVASAEAEAREAGDLAAALEERVKDGDDSVTPAELTSARELQKFARLRVEAAGRKAERAREAERQRQLAALKEEILTRPTADRARLAGLLHAAEDALMEFVAELHGHNGQVQAWYDRMLALQVPEATTPVPGVEHRRMAWRNGYTGPVLLVGYPAQRFEQLDTRPFLASVVNRVTGAHNVEHVARPLDVDPYELLTGGE